MQRRFKAKCIARRLIVEPYPSKAQFKAEAHRDDCESWPMIHVDIVHDYWDTISLYNLLDHEWPPRNLPKPLQLKLSSSDDNLRNATGIVRAQDLELEAFRKRKWDGSRSDSGWWSPQIMVWWHDESKEAYRMWIEWCKRVLKRVQMYGAASPKAKPYNPFEGLRFRVRVEFHD